MTVRDLLDYIPGSAEIRFFNEREELIACGCWREGVVGDLPFGSIYDVNRLLSIKGGCDSKGVPYLAIVMDMSDEDWEGGI